MVVNLSTLTFAFLGSFVYKFAIYISLDFPTYEIFFFPKS